ncbi:unnamed protein product [Onchocerca flexuosa]|uniref:Uncharacterized protein n=1 Tax=Onchocerca flexuosa TaxID=387005 RepID=A0A183HL32_9BILA|nr:unnamed protein product [Onchocerca flexuosa]
MDIRHSKHFDVARSPLPIHVSEDGGSHYEEIDDEMSVPKVMLQQINNESKSSTVDYLTTLDDHSGQQLQDIVHEVIDIQTNL